MDYKLIVFKALAENINEAIQEDGDNRYTRYGNYYKDAVMKRAIKLNPEIDQINLYKAYDWLEAQGYIITTVAKRTYTKATKKGFKWFEEASKPKNDRYTVFENKNWKIEVFGGDKIAVYRLTPGHRQAGYVMTVDGYTFINIQTPKYIEQKALNAYKKIGA